MNTCRECGAEIPEPVGYCSPGCREAHQWKPKEALDKQKKVGA